VPEELGFRRLLFLATGALGTAFLPSWIALLKQGYDCEIRLAVTAGAKKFVTLTALSAISGNPVSGPDWQEDQSAGAEHLLLADWSEVVIAFPASLDFCAKIAHGLSNDVPTAIIATTEAPVVIAPSAGGVSLDKAQSKRIIRTLRENGHYVLDTVSGMSITTSRFEGGAPIPFAKLLQVLRRLSTASPDFSTDRVKQAEKGGTTP
jgi:phosphopantothenoylcysteine decarboxylase/phosphopantothenate--cysteine ligase